MTSEKTDLKKGWGKNQNARRYEMKGDKMGAFMTQGQGTK